MLQESGAITLEPRFRDIETYITPMGESRKAYFISETFTTRRWVVLYGELVFIVRTLNSLVHKQRTPHHRYQEREGLLARR